MEELKKRLFNAQSLKGLAGLAVAFGLLSADQVNNLMVMSQDNVLVLAGGLVLYGLAGILRK